MSRTSNLTATDTRLWNTPEHHGPAVSVVTWLLIIAVVLAVTARTITRFTITMFLRWDDYIVLLAMVSPCPLFTESSLISTIHRSWPSGSRLQFQPRQQQGSVLRHTHSPPSTSFASKSIHPCKDLPTGHSQRTDWAQSNYASNLLYIRTLGLVKVSICFHIYSLTPVRTHRMVRVAAGAFCALWALLSLVVAAFEYSPPDVWRNLGSKCINLLTFWTYFGILNIVTDLGMIGLPLPHHCHAA